MIPEAEATKERGSRRVRRPKAPKPTTHNRKEEPPPCPRPKQPPQPLDDEGTQDTLWKAADKLRGSLSANQYKDVILGLVFLKYVSDAYDERREAIRAELIADGMDDDQITELIDDRRSTRATACSWSPIARWTYLAENAKGKPATDDQPARNVGELIDEAMDAVMAANKSLQGTLPRIYNRDNIDQRRLGELIDLFNSARFSRQGEHKARDLMGEVYEYFLGNFARAEGKRAASSSPRSVVRVIVEVLEPKKGRVYDPCCGSGGMFVQTEQFIYEHDGDPKDVAIYGQEAIEETWRMAKMNLAIHGIDNNGVVRAGATPSPATNTPTSRWTTSWPTPVQHQGLGPQRGRPPLALRRPPVRNANYAWLQHILYKLAPGGKAGVVLANGSMSSNSNGEGDIRREIVDADLVSAMIALPTQLFRSTGIPVCLWFFAKDKTKGTPGSEDRSGQVLFIDARDLGYMVDRAERALSDDDIVRIGDTYHAWRGSSSAVAKGISYEDVPGFCKSASLAEIAAAGYALTPAATSGAPK